MTSTFHQSHSHWGAFTAEVCAGRIVAVSPFEKDPFPSELIRSIPDALQGEARVRFPVVRKGWLEEGPESRKRRGAEPFVRVTWDKALDLVAGELDRVKRAYGNEAIFGGSYGWSSAGCLHHAKTLVHRFLSGFGGYVDQVNNYSYGAGMVIMPHVVGGNQVFLSPVGSGDAFAGPATTWPSIVKHTGLMVGFGGFALKNGQVTAGGAGEHGYEKWLGRAAEAGVEFVSISPVKDDAPEFLAAEWIPIRPNTDTALMLAIAHRLHEEGLHDTAFLGRYTHGFERFRAYLTGETDGVGKDADWAAGITGIDAETIRGLAGRMAEARTMIAATWSLQRADKGEQPFWMTVTLAAMLGQIGLPGGGFGFGYGSIGGPGIPRKALPVPNMAQGPNPVKPFIPVARIADALLNPGGEMDYDGRKITLPDIKIVYWAGGNPFHHHQDLNRLVRAFRCPEAVIVNEPFWTATARHADIVLPATTPLERNDIGASSRDRFLIAMYKAIEPVGEARNDFDVFAGLAERLGFSETFTEGRGEMEWLRHLYDVACQKISAFGEEMPGFESFWADGHVEFAEPADDFVLFEDFRRDPQRNRLRTPSGGIELFSETIAGFGYDDCPGHAAWLEPAEWLGSSKATAYPLHLVSNQPATRLHGQLDTGPISRASKVGGREPIRIHPEDATPRGITEGDVVRVFNARGACLA
ncbi:MAG: molybdopterin-dependent oxidoreductase, partial [Rhodospirillales bacterium]|nr:molybdopterin-dependent oxidoreductase [Rhodospirillales bacterium]